jgi:hypothetical protein
VVDGDQDRSHHERHADRASQERRGAERATEATGDGTGARLELKSGGIRVVALASGTSGHRSGHRADDRHRRLPRLRHARRSGRDRHAGSATSRVTTSVNVAPSTVGVPIAGWNRPSWRVTHPVRRPARRAPSTSHACTGRDLPKGHVNAGCVQGEGVPQEAREPLRQRLRGKAGPAQARRDRIQSEQRLDDVEGHDGGAHGSGVWHGIPFRRTGLWRPIAGE